MKLFASKKDRIANERMEDPSIGIPPGDLDHPSERLRRERFMFSTVICCLTAFSSIVVIDDMRLRDRLDNQRPQFWFYSFDDLANRTINLTHGEITRDEETQIFINTLSEYVTKRESIDHVTDKSRDEWLKIFTDKHWFKAYDDHMNPLKNPRSIRTFYRKEGLTRSIHNVTVSPQPDKPNEFYIRYETADYNATEEISGSRKRWQIDVTVRRDPRDGLTAHEAALNPLNIKVMNYVPMPVPDSE
ncbi:VirB8/TrbF family protein [Aestuariispira insulae]|uniref:VirB8 protein n=1 Tax=Aestuariispira insulae TaxID=1461337 RepID=A0A3D9H3P1_9PROT|nr:VirB8/TrbF family protein [Aestuariispira insulae]RED44117.1 VirB8 protein [Aestuariispira insulae]